MSRYLKHAKNRPSLTAKCFLFNKSGCQKKFCWFNKNKNTALHRNRPSDTQRKNKICLAQGSAVYTIARDNESVYHTMKVGYHGLAYTSHITSDQSLIEEGLDQIYIVMSLRF